MLDRSTIIPSDTLAEVRHIYDVIFHCKHSWLLHIEVMPSVQGAREQGLKFLKKKDCVSMEGMTYYVSEDYKPIFSDNVIKNEKLQKQN